MKNIIIVGGGLAGSLMAVYFAQRNCHVKLYERRGDMRKQKMSAGRSINLALSLRGITALKKVGLDEEIFKEAIPMRGRMMHDASGNLSYQPYGKDGQFINSVSRGLLNVRLLELADHNKKVELFFNHKCLDVDFEKNTVSFENEDGQIIHETADLIVGADGAYSAVRMAMQISGRFDFSQSYLKHGYKELTIESKNGDFAMEPNALHIWPRGTYMLIALPNPDKTFTCTLFLPFDGNPGFDDLNTKEEVKAFFETHFADAVALMPNYLEDFFKNPTSNLVTVKAFPFRKNNTVLIGDAAHAIVPFYGQGMNCSFEDCLVLDQMLENYLPNLDKALDAYETERKPNADAIADLAIQNFIEMRDLVGDKNFLHFKAIEHKLSELYPQQFQSQYELVTFSNKPYSYAQNRGQRNTELVKEIIKKGLEEKIDDEVLMQNFFNRYGLSS